MRLLAVPAGLALAGAVVLIVAGGSLPGTLVGGVLISIAGVVAISLVFYAVGRSEDREREADAAARRRAADKRQRPH